MKYAYLGVLMLWPTPTMAEVPAFAEAVIPLSAMIDRHASVA